MERRRSSEAKVVSGVDIREFAERYSLEAQLGNWSSGRFRVVNLLDGGETEIVGDSGAENMGIAHAGLVIPPAVGLAGIGRVVKILDGGRIRIVSAVAGK